MDKIQQVKVLINDHNTLVGAHDRYLKAIEPASIDKHGFGFGIDDRFAAFEINTSFDSKTGSYGSSSCGTLISVGDKEKVQKAFIKAMNKHSKLLFDTAASYLLEEASKIKEEAKKEVDASHAMLQSLPKPEVATDA